MTKTADFIQRWITGPLKHLVDPRQCAMCQRVLPIGSTHFCSDCLRTLPLTEEGWHRDNRVECLFADMHKFTRGAAYCFYPAHHPIRNAIQLMKFSSQPEIGREMGRMAAQAWADSSFFEGIDYIIPLPLHFKRLRERGYNQAEWIAMGIHDVTGIPIDTKHLYRTHNNTHQSKKNLTDRRELTQIFGVHQPNDLREKHVLLIDDVITSGTTMLRAMEALHPIYRCHYSVFALAIAHQ